VAQRLSVADYQWAAERRLPRLVSDYVDGGAETEATVRGNRRAFTEVRLRPRGAVDPSGVDLKVSVMGGEVSMPVLLAPCGMARVVHPGGDAAAARAAGRAGTIFCLSTMSGHRVEEVVAAAAGAPVWYQLYRVGTHGDAEAALCRARDAGVSAVVVTIDSAVGSLRERDRRNGGLALLGASPWRVSRASLRLLGSPSWLYGRTVDGVYPKLMNALDRDGEPYVLGRNPPPIGLTWEELDLVRRHWQGPIVIKGVLGPEDAVRSVEEGASAIVVSNHGGRQLDTAEATLRVLPEVVAAVEGRCEVLMDGGVRSGIDVIKALSLGAKAVLVGRPWLYGLGADGESGVDGVLAILRDGLQRNLALLGAGSVSTLDARYVRTPADWYHPGWQQSGWHQSGRDQPGRDQPGRDQPDREQLAKDGR